MTCLAVRQLTRQIQTVEMLPLGSDTGTGCDWAFVSQRDVPVYRLSGQSIQLMTAQVCGGGTDKR